jgi:LPXTG-site transpeptidase (sortase) family protein
MQNNLINFLEPKTHNKSGSRPSILKLVSVYVIAFVIVLTLLNKPLIISLIQYPLFHSEESDNEKITAEYIRLYGYETQQKKLLSNVALSTVVQAATPSVPTVISPVQTSVRNPTLSIPPVTVRNSIVISKINISAPIIQVSSSDDKTILNALKIGVLFYPGSAYPGQNGSTVIVGHSSSNPPWTKYSAIFSLLNKLAPNDLINITFGGKEYTYQVKRIEKGSVQHILDSGLGGDLILSSCWPVGTDNGRIVVVADMIR